jgi:hypothetical protein
MRDERARRRPNYRPGLKLRLADGQVWSLPIPLSQEEAALSQAANPNWNDASYRLLIDAIVNSGDRGELFRAELALAIHLLDWNYSLAPEDFEELLDEQDGSLNRLDLGEILHMLAMAHVGLVVSTPGLSPQGSSTSRRDDFRRLIGQIASRIFGRRVHHEAGAGRSPQNIL